MTIHLPEAKAPGKTGSSLRACPAVPAYLWSRAMRRRPARFSLLLALFAAITATALASADGHGLSYDVWLILAGMLLAAKLGGEIAVRLNQPAVLGEHSGGRLCHLPNDRESRLTIPAHERRSTLRKFYEDPLRARGFLRRSECLSSA